MPRLCPPRSAPVLARACRARLYAIGVHLDALWCHATVGPGTWAPRAHGAPAMAAHRAVACCRASPVAVAA